MLKAFAFWSLGATAPATDNRTRFGRLTVEAHRRHRELTGEYLCVFLDGVDVTECCREADDVVGYVQLFTKSPTEYAFWRQRGGRVIDDFYIEVTGDVRIRPGGPLR
jgi:hypothetical protein